MKKFAISIGTSKVLAAAVISSVYKLGRGNRNTSESKFLELVNEYIGHDGAVVYIYPNNFTYSARGYYDRNEQSHFPLLDARTQLGEIIDMLSNAEVVIKALAREGSSSTTRDGVISADGKEVTVGCSNVSFAKVEEVYLAMKKLQEK
jgi:hypothetical protein